MTNKNLAKFIKELKENKDISYIFCAIEPSHEDDRSDIAILCNGSEVKLKMLLTVFVNQTPELRRVFSPTFVEFSRHAPEELGGDGDMEAAISAAIAEANKQIAEANKRK